MAKIKTKSEELLPIWDDLCDIFSNQARRHISQSQINRLMNLGIRVEHVGGHIKMYFNHNNKNHIVVASSSASDGNSNRQLLREIRRIYEKDSKND